ncbi:MAG TPA: thioredoxin family protein [Spirochaetota bacterium]|nr:thioredoxin family protein [Spirochaetota bacterium]
MIDEATVKKAKDLLGKLADPVKLIVFTQEIECNNCKETVALIKELSKIDPKIESEVYDFQKNEDAVKKYGIDKIPAIVVEKETEDYGIRFYGIPSGYEFVSLLETIRTVSTGEHGLGDETVERIKGIDTDVHLQVFVTPTCPYCPRAVITAHRFAFLSPKVKSDMVEVIEFPHLGNKYGVMGVPRTVINEDQYIEGAVPEKVLADKIFQVLEK